MKNILIWFLPYILDILRDALRKWVDDPDTETDQNAINAVGAYIRYLADKKRGVL